MFYVGNGINAAMEDWGQAMRHRYGKDDAFRETDFSINYVGYAVCAFYILSYLVHCMLNL